MKAQQPAVRFFLLTLAGASLFLGLSPRVRAAVYNIYLNNTEQGPNSTATPQVHVESAPSTANAPEAAPTTAKVEAPPAVPLTPPPAPATVAPTSAPSVSESLASQSSPYEWKRRFTVGGMAYKEKTFGSHSGGFSLNLAYSPLSYLGFNLGGGAVLDDPDGEKRILGLAELEITPVRLNLFGYPDVLEVGALAGVSTLARVGGNWGSVHVGGRVAWNFGGRFVVNTTVRFNRGFLMGDAGLGVRF